MNNEKMAIIEIIKGIEYLINKNDRSTKIYTGMIESIDNNTYTVKVNGKNYQLPLYGNNTLSVGSIVKVFIPQNNMNLAFIM